LATDKHNWDLILQEVKEALLEGCEPIMASIARELGMSRSTLKGGLRRNFGIKANDLAGLTVSTKEPETTEKEGLTYKTTTDEDYMTLDIKLSDTKTLDEMLKICRVDLSVWEVERWVIGNYNAHRKNETKDLQWTDGKMDGSVWTDGTMTIQPMQSIKVWLKRKVPLKPEIVLHPIELIIETTKPIKTERKAVETAVIIPDLQIGFSKDIHTGKVTTFHDRKALDVALQITEHMNPEKIIFLGDVLDLPDWTDKFLKSPEFFWSTQSAVIEAVWWLTQFKFVAPNAEIHFLFGNHENRMNTGIISNLKAAYNLKPADELDLPPALSIERLLCLDKLGIKYVNTYPGEVWINDNIRCIHGNIARRNSLDTVRALISNKDTTTIQVHIHRTEIAMRKIQRQNRITPIYGFSPGCLCKLDGSVPGTTKDNNWNHGIGIIQYNDQYHNIFPIVFDNGIAICDGLLFTARDRLKQMKKDTGWDSL